MRRVERRGRRRVGGLHPLLLLGMSRVGEIELRRRRAVERDIEGVGSGAR